jgi:CelD/BcsL family acetyltransferase involved in cellulose biosynthesis
VLLHKSYGFSPLALVTTDRAGGEITAGLPFLEVGTRFGRRRLVALPFTDRCEPLATSGADYTERLAEFRRQNGNPQIEVRSEVGNIAADARLVGEWHTLSLDRSLEEIRTGFRRVHRQNIRIAERADVEIRFGASGDDMETFYALHLVTRRRLGVPIQPRRFFNSLLRDLLAAGKGFVASAYWHGVPIASNVYLTHNRSIINKFAALDRRYSARCGNHLLTWEVIQRAKTEGYGILDWGRTDLGNEGLSRFKDGWGGERRPLMYSYWGSRPDRASVGFVREAIGATIRNSPMWVCQVFGEALYKYSA